MLVLGGNGEIRVAVSLAPVSTTARLPLTIAAAVVALQAAAFLALAVADLTGLVADRIGLGIGIAIVLLVLGIGLLLAAAGLRAGLHGARGPVVVAQLIGLGLAWSLRSPDENVGDNRLAGAVIASSAVIVLVCLATPSARRALADDPAGNGDGDRADDSAADRDE